MTQDSLTTVFDGITAAAAVSGIAIAFAGLRTWRDQLKGASEYELARRLLRAVLQVRDQISFVRHPMITGGEFAAAYAEAGLEMKDDAALNDPRADELVYDRRWKQLTKAMSDLQVELLEAEVLWGRMLHAPAEELQRCVTQLLSAVRHHLRSRARTSAYREERVPEDVREKHFRSLYAVGSAEDPDQFAAQVQTVVGAFERLLRPKLHFKDSAPAA